MPSEKVLFIWDMNKEINLHKWKLKLSFHYMLRFTTFSEQKLSPYIPILHTLKTIMFFLAFKEPRSVMTDFWVVRF